MPLFPEMLGYQSPVSLDDKWRMALLGAAAGLTGGTGTFGQKAGRGLQGLALGYGRGLELMDEREEKERAKADEVRRRHTFERFYPALDYGQFSSDAADAMIEAGIKGQYGVTDDMQEFRMAQENPEFAQFLEGNKPSGPSVNIYGDEIPTEFLKAAIKAEDTSTQAANTVVDLQNMLELSKTADTGALAPIWSRVSAVFEDLGVEVNPDLPVIQQMQAVQNQLALRLRNPESGLGLTGNTSNKDIAFLTGAVAGIEKTPEANQAITITMLAKQRRIAELEAMKAEWIYQNGTLRGWATARDRYVEENSIFTPEEQEFLASLQEVAEPVPTTGPSQFMINGQPVIVRPKGTVY